MTAILATSLVVERSGSKPGITFGPPAYSSRLCSSSSCQKSSSRSSRTPRFANSVTTSCHSGLCAVLSGLPSANSRRDPCRGTPVGVCSSRDVGVCPLSSANSRREPCRGSCDAVRETNCSRRAWRMTVDNHVTPRRRRGMAPFAFACDRRGCHKRPDSNAMQMVLITKSSLCMMITERTSTVGGRGVSPTSPQSNQVMTRVALDMPQVTKVESPRKRQEASSTVITFLAHSTSTLGMPRTRLPSCSNRTPRPREVAATLM
mmetsp:Transcript_72813/g.210838  ORF Transcript_72813/g.210838 Transcript_72813/m.210838 type:complete len:261 (+) Transcript_72813:1068-1850(+)